MTSTPPLTRTVWACTALCGLIVIGPLSLAIFIPTLPAVQAEFGADVQIVQLTLSMPLLAVVLVPLLAGTTSDRIGRRPVLLSSLIILLAGCIGCYLAPDIWTLVVGRTVVGVAGSCCLIVGSRRRQRLLRQGCPGPRHGQLHGCARDRASDRADHRRFPDRRFRLAFGVRIPRRGKPSWRRS